MWMGNVLFEILALSPINLDSLFYSNILSPGDGLF